MNTQQLAKLRSIVPEMRRVRHIHFVGIGGAGMGGIAEVLANEGYQISGSDLAPNPVTQQLMNLGATIYFNHRPENVRDASVVVVSSAISADNPEIVAAHECSLSCHSGFSVSVTCACPLSVLSLAVKLIWLNERRLCEYRHWAWELPCP